MAVARGARERGEADVQQRSMNIAVGDDHVAFLSKSKKSAQIGLNPRPEHQRRLAAHEARKLFVEPQVKVHRAVEHSRTRTARAISRDGFDGRSFDFGVRGEAQVIVRAEHKHAAVAHHNFGLARIYRAGKFSEVRVKPCATKFVRFSVTDSFLEYVFRSNARRLLHNAHPHSTASLRSPSIYEGPCRV